MARLFQFVRDLMRPRMAKIAAGAVGALGGYDALSSQTNLPKLSEIWGVIWMLLPWWGWLLLAQASIVVALLEYVRRTTFNRSGSPADTAFEEKLENDPAGHKPLLAQQQPPQKLSLMAKGEDEQTKEALSAPQPRPLVRTSALEQVIQLSKLVEKATEAYRLHAKLVVPESGIEWMRGFDIKHKLENYQREVVDCVNSAEHIISLPERNYVRAEFTDLHPVARGGVDPRYQLGPRFKFDENQPFLACAKYNHSILSGEVERLKTALELLELKLSESDKMLLKIARSAGHV